MWKRTRYTTQYSRRVALRTLRTGTYFSQTNGSNNIKAKPEATIFEVTQLDSTNLEIRTKTWGMNPNAFKTLVDLYRLVTNHLRSFTKKWYPQGNSNPRYLREREVS